MGNITSTEEVTMANIATQLNIINHKLNYCFSKIDKVSARVTEIENYISEYDLEDYNEVFLSDSDNIQNKHESALENNVTNNQPIIAENSSFIFRNNNDFTWDYYEIDQTYLKYIDTNK